MRHFFDRYGQIGAYVLIVAVAILAFARVEAVRSDRAEDLAQQTEQRQTDVAEQTQRRQTALAEETERRQTERVELTNQLCIQSEISREALRQQIVATAELARSLVPAQNPDLVAKVLEFQDGQLANLPPIVCETDGK